MAIFDYTTDHHVSVYNDYTDLILLGLSKNDDQLAFTTLYGRHKDAVFKHAYLFHNDYDKAQDVTQEVFVKLWEKRKDFHINSNFNSYIHVMVRRINLNHIAHQEVEQKYEDYTVWSQETSSNSVEDYIIEKELSDILAKKIDALPRKMKEVFSLSRDEQLSHQEISERLRISTKTVRQQIYNALLNLKSNLKYVFLFFFS